MSGKVSSHYYYVSNSYSSRHLHKLCVLPSKLCIKSHHWMYINYFYYQSHNDSSLCNQTVKEFNDNDICRLNFEAIRDGSDPTCEFRRPALCTDDCATIGRSISCSCHGGVSLMADNAINYPPARGACIRNYFHSHLCDLVILSVKWLYYNWAVTGNADVIMLTAFCPPVEDDGHKELLLLTIA